MSTATEQRNLLTELESAFIKRGFQDSPSRLHTLELLKTKGLPGIKSEEYKFTPVVRHLEKFQLNGLHPAADHNPVSVSLELIPSLPCNQVVFRNGRYAPHLSSLLDKEIKVSVRSLPEADRHQDSFDLLNLAFAEEEVHMQVESGKTPAHPLAVIYLIDSAEPCWAMPRWDCSVDRNAALTLLEYTVRNGSTPFINTKSSLLRVAENAEVKYIILQHQPGEIQVSNARVELATASRASCFTFSFDGQLIRNNLTLTLNGQGIDAHLYGLYMLSKNTHVDNHTVVDHRQPNSFSNQLYKGIVQDTAKGVFNGKIFVRPDAQKTNAFQSNRNIVLGDQATVHTKPQLEIWADDVKCSHGCTTGQLDEEALFYLRSRGISKEQAQGMLLHAFASETLSTLTSEPIRDFVEQIIQTKLYQIQ